MTRQQRIAELKAQFPTMVSTINGEAVQLSQDEYELAIENLAIMQEEQEAAAAQRDAQEMARASALAKLAAFGLTEEEAAALVGQ